MFGGLNAEVRWSSTFPGTDPHLHAARMNLSSTSSRKSVFDAIKTRFEKGDEKVQLLQDFIEITCVLVVKKFREGRPLVNLANVTPEPPSFHVGKVIPLYKRVQVYAPAESMKTTFLLAMLMDIATGGSELGFDVKQTPVAYLDWETDHNDAGSIWHRLAQARGIETPDLFYQRLHRPLWEECESLEPQLRAEGVKACLLDSAFWASGTNPNSQENVGLMFQGMDALGDEMTTILINHTGADESDKKRRRHYGLEHFRNAVRASWELRKAAKMPNDPYVHLGLFRDKLNMRAEEGPFAFKVRFEGDDGPIYVEQDRDGITEVPELEESLPNGERVHRYILHNGRSTPAEIAEGTGIPIDSVYTAVSRLKNQLQSSKEGKSTYYGIRTDTMFDH